MTNKLTNSRRIAKSFPVFKTVEELISHAQGIIPPEKVIQRIADGDMVNAEEYFVNLNKISNMVVDLGMKKGNMVGVYLRNCVEYSYLYMALGRLGIVIVPINQFLKGDSLCHIIKHSDIEFLVTCEDMFFDQIKPIAGFLDKLKTVLFVGKSAEDDTFKTGQFSNFKNYSSEFELPWSVESEDMQGLWYTSGTTGLPKGIMVSYEYLLYRTSFFVDYFRLTPSDAIYFILPMYHQPYFCWGIAMAMASGCEIINVNWFSASKFWEDVANYKATAVFSTGTIIPILLKREIEKHEIAGKELLRLWVGWPVDEPDIVKTRWPKTKFLEGYGLSEYNVASITSYDNPELGTSGPPTPYTELKISNPENGVEVSDGITGEIVVTSKLGPGHKMLGYYKAPKETKKALKDGWVYTGDLGYIDKKGLLHFVDRHKDSVRVGGENVPSAELEAMIMKNPKIKLAAVVGVKGELGHSEIIAHVVLKEGEQLSPEEFFGFCHKEMAYYMIPRYLFFRKEFPITATLKIQKYKIREEGISGGCFDRKDYLSK